MSSRRIPMRALVSSPILSPAAPRARILLLVGVLLSALVFAFAFARTDTASAVIPPSDFEGNDGNLVTDGAGSDWQAWTGNAGLVLKSDDLGDSQFSGGA